MDVLQYSSSLTENCHSGYIRRIKNFYTHFLTMHTNDLPIIQNPFVILEVWVYSIIYKFYICRGDIPKIVVTDSHILSFKTRFKFSTDQLPETNNIKGFSKHCAMVNLRSKMLQVMKFRKFMRIKGKLRKLNEIA